MYKVPNHKHIIMLPKSVEAKFKIDHCIEKD